MKAKLKTPVDVLEAIKSDDVKWLDLQFVDLTGALQHVAIPHYELHEEDFRTGVGKLDGSSIRGFKEIQDSDMCLKPVPSTYTVLPWYGPEHLTARMICTVFEGGGRERFTRDSRFVAEKAVEAAAGDGYDQTWWGPELEFFVFNSVKLLPSPEAVLHPWAGCGYAIESSEAPWNSNGGTNYPIRFKEGYYPAPPVDTGVEFRNEACRMLEEYFGFHIEAHHHEVATSGQGEINFRRDGLVESADGTVTFKYVLRNVAHRMGKICTFMPKPIFGDNASGMHVHQSLWTKGKNVFYDPDDAYAEISQKCRYYIGGLMDHARSLCPFTNPTTNSYRRLVPGYEAPVFIAYSKANRSANIRIPMYKTGEEKSKRIEYRTPDPSCNPYLTFASCLAAGLDGIKKQKDPGDPTDEDIYRLTDHRKKELGIRELPGSLKESIQYLETDYIFLKSVFSQDFLDKYIELKMEEHLQTSLRPSPWEFYKYLDA